LSAECASQKYFKIGKKNRSIIGKDMDKSKMPHFLWPTVYTVSQKSIPIIFDCNFRTNYLILINLNTNIPDTTCHQMTIQFPISPNVCFCTTLGKHNQQNIAFYPMRYDCLINITCKNTFCLHFWHFGWHFIQLSIFQLPAVKCLNCWPTMRTQARRCILHLLTAVSIKFCSKPIQAVPVASSLHKHF